MDELELFRDFNSRASGPSGEAQRRALAGLTRYLCDVRSAHTSLGPDVTASRLAVLDAWAERADSCRASMSATPRAHTAAPVRVPSLSC